jgi:hypothetical protein
MACESNNRRDTPTRDVGRSARSAPKENRECAAANMNYSALLARATVEARRELHLDGDAGRYEELVMVSARQIQEGLERALQGVDVDLADRQAISETSKCDPKQE